MTKFTSYTQGTPCWVELTTPDQKAGAQFYTDLFGWDIEESPIDEESVYLTGKLRDAEIAGIAGQMPALAGQPAFWGVYLAVDDVDAVTAKIEQAGGRVDAGPFDVLDAGRMTALQDPTGARVGLWQAGRSIGTELANEPGTPTWNELVSPDLPRALQFYADVVGIGSSQSEMVGDYDTLTNVAGDMIGGAVPPMADGVPPHWNVYFKVADADATAAQIEALGGTTVAPNFDVEVIGRMGFYSDPQGAAFAILQDPPA
jgi:predicted enzyme related to lactoylglutathione lyase